MYGKDITSGKMSNSESAVSWKKVTVIGLVVGVPVTGYLIWRSLKNKNIDEVQGIERKKKVGLESLTTTEPNKPDIILSAEAENHAKEEPTEVVPKADVEGDDNEFVLSLSLEDKSSETIETEDHPKEVDGEFFLTLDLNNSTDISNETTLQLGLDDIKADSKDTAEASDDFRIIGSLDQLSLSEVNVARLSDRKEDGEGNKVSYFDKELLSEGISSTHHAEVEESHDNLSSFDKLSDLPSLQPLDEREITGDRDGMMNQEISLESDVNPTATEEFFHQNGSLLEPLISGDTNETTDDIKISFDLDTSGLEEKDTPQIPTDVEMGKNSEESSWSLMKDEGLLREAKEGLVNEEDKKGYDETKEDSSGTEMKQDENQRIKENVENLDDKQKTKEGTDALSTEVLVPDKIVVSAAVSFDRDVKVVDEDEGKERYEENMEESLKPERQSEGSSDIEELEENPQATSDENLSSKYTALKDAESSLTDTTGHVTDSAPPDHVTTVVDDENDIVVIKDEEKLKPDNLQEEASRHLASEDDSLSVPFPEDVSPLYLSHPYTRDLVPLGCSLKSVLQTEQHMARKGPSQKSDRGATYARHYITDVKTKGLAQMSALRNGQELCYVSKVPTCGMSHDMVVVMVAGVNLTDGNPLLLTIRTEYSDEFGVKSEQCDTAVISFSVTPTGFCIKNIHTEPYRGRKLTDSFWNDTRPFSEERCWVQHMKSQLYVKGSGRLLTLSALKNPNPFYLYLRDAVRGGHLPPTPSSSTFWKEPQVMLAYPGDTEKGKRVQQFVSCVGTDAVAFLPLQEASGCPVVLNDKDPRLFYFISRGSHCYFMSVTMNDHFLAAGEGLASLCLRFVPEHRELSRRPELKFTVQYPTAGQEKE